MTASNQSSMFFYLICVQIFCFEKMYCVGSSFGFIRDGVEVRFETVSSSKTYSLS